MEPNKSYCASEISDRVKRVHGAQKELIDSLLDLTESIDPFSGSEEQVAELIMCLSTTATTAKQAREHGESRVLEWFAKNESQIDSVTIGDLKYFGDRGKSVFVGKGLFPEAITAVVSRSVHDQVMDLVDGNVELFGDIVSRIGQALSTLVSANGLKHGACKKLLGDEEFGMYWVTKWRDKLGKGEPAKRLGVANVRFIEAAKVRGDR